MSKPISLHTPEQAPSLRVMVVLKGDLAAEVKALASEYQTEMASMLRELAVDGIRARKRLREVS